MSSKRQLHDIRIIELNNLLKNGDPSISRMKELYHTISAKHVSKVNMPIYTALGEYLNRRLTGMDHMTAYVGSNLRINDVATSHKIGTKAAKRNTLTRLKDKVAVKELEKQMKASFEEAKAEGIAEEDFKKVFYQMIEAQGFRPEFMRSFYKASDNLKLENSPSSGGGAGNAE